MAEQLKKRAAALLRSVGPKVKRFRYPALILLAGLVLLLFPKKNSETIASGSSGASGAAVEGTEDAGITGLQKEAPLPAEAYRQQTEQTLRQILSRIEGAGRVEVMLTLKSGSSVSYQSDSETSTQTGEQGESSTSSSRTVILSGSGAYDTPAVVKTDYPEFQGALIVSEGANNASVRLALTQATSVVLGLSSDKITVVKMK